MLQLFVDYSLHNFTYVAQEANRQVVSRVIAFIFLMNRNYICCLPERGEMSSTEAISEELC